MVFPFFNRIQTKKIVVGTANEDGQFAHTVLEGLLRELPELLMSCIVDIASGKVVAFYTTNNNYNPNQVSLRYAKVFRTVRDAQRVKAWPGGPLTDISLLLEDQLHQLYPLHSDQWYCLVVMRTDDANMAVVKDVIRRNIA